MNGFSINGSNSSILRVFSAPKCIASVLRNSVYTIVSGAMVLMNCRYEASVTPAMGARATIGRMLSDQRNMRSFYLKKKHELWYNDRKCAFPHSSFFSQSSSRSLRTHSRRLLLFRKAGYSERAILLRERFILIAFRSTSATSQNSFFALQAGSF